MPYTVAVTTLKQYVRKDAQKAPTVLSYTVRAEKRNNRTIFIIISLGRKTNNKKEKSQDPRVDTHGSKRTVCGLSRTFN